MQHKYNKGLSIIELVIMVSVVTIALVGVLGVATFSLSLSANVQKTAEAVALGEELMEVVRNYRDGVAWNNDSPGIATDGFGVLNFSSGPFHLVKASGTPATWTMVAGAEVVGVFTREVAFVRLQRDSNDDIVVSGTEDAESVQTTVTVSWQDRGNTESIQLVSYITNWQQL